MAQNRKDRRAEMTGPVKPAPDAPDATPVDGDELETLPITQDGWVGEPITAPADWVDAETVRASGFVVESQFAALWPAFTPALVESIAAAASIPHVEMGGERLYLVKDVADTLTAWFKSASYNRAVAARKAEGE